MLLETLDVKRNDILIYSENKFDFAKNFKIIYKKEASKKPSNISYWEVGKYINSPVPKNLILYRLLTNIPDFNSGHTKFGTLIQINNSPEVIYYDPIFAIKELEELNGKIDFQSFRFKIDQIGLSSLSIQNGLQNYRELYHFDLRADEAKYQNDKVFAEAIFAFDNDFDSKPESAHSPVEEDSTPKKTNSYKPLNLILSEVENPKEIEMQNLDTLIDTDSDKNKHRTSMGEFLKKHKKKESGQTLHSTNDNLLTLFKSADSYVSSRSGESVILHFGKKKE